jgi:hypothetical protein
MIDLAVNQLEKVTGPTSFSKYITFEVMTGGTGSA